MRLKLWFVNNYVYRNFVFSNPKYHGRVKSLIIVIKDVPVRVGIIEVITRCPEEVVPPRLHSLLLLVV